MHIILIPNINLLIQKEDVVAQEAGVTIYYMNSRHFNAIECDERK